LVNPEEAFEVGTCALDKGLPNIAASAFAVSEQSERSDIRGKSKFNLAVNLFRREKGNHKEELKWIERGIAHNDPMSFFSKALRLEEQGDDEAAMAAYRFAIQKGSLKAATNLGRVLLRLNNIDDGLALLRRAAELGDAKAWPNLALHYTKNSRYEDLRALLGVALEREDKEILEQLAIVANAADQVDKFVQYLREFALEGNIASQHQLGGVLLEFGEREEAEEWLSKAADQGHAGPP
jgi:TPR repeat protein